MDAKTFISEVPKSVTEIWTSPVQVPKSLAEVWTYAREVPSSAREVQTLLVKNPIAGRFSQKCLKIEQFRHRERMSGWEF